MPKDNKKAIDYWDEYVLRPIYDPRRNFNKGAPPKHWWSILGITGIVCDLFKINIVIYSLPKPCTYAFEYKKDIIQYTEVIGKNDLNIGMNFIGKEKNTLYMVYTDENYFKFYQKNL